MQTLGIADSTPKSESRLKSLFWPDIKNGTDVDYLGTQGYLLCTLVALITVALSFMTGQVVGGILGGLYYYVGGVGVRERSRYAALMVLTLYLLESTVTGASVARVLFTALLLSNLRATWMSALWNPQSEEALLPARLNETLGDKFTDRFPQWLWPKVRYIYYVFAFAILTLGTAGVIFAFIKSRR